MVLAPFLISQVVKTYGFLILLANNGLFNQVLLGVHLTEQPLRILYSEAGVIVGMVHVLLPFMIIILEGTIRQIDPELFEAALGLGADGRRVVREVLLPLTLPGLVGGSLLVFSLAVSLFTAPALMGGGRVHVMSTLIYTRSVTLFDWPMGAAASILLLVTVLVVGTVYSRLLGRYRWRAES
jgi:putative spermidine/putrescine transport system permease protein